MKPGQLARKSNVTRAHIRAFVMGNPRATVPEVAAAIGLSCTPTKRHLLAMVAAGELAKVGHRYSVSNPRRYNRLA